jgi:ribosomal protein S12 methylthiotransferase accessory factor
MYARALLVRRPDWRPEPDFRNVREFEDHVRLYCEPEMKAHLDFLLRSPRVRGVDPGSPDEPPDESTAAAQLASAAAMVRAAALEPIAVDITPPDVAAAGLACVKVLIPGAVPLASIHGMTPVGSPRLFEVPARLGRSAGAQLNRIPHPFP